jgi:rare lipoprotein A
VNPIAELSNLYPVATILLLGAVTVGASGCARNPDAAASATSSDAEPLRISAAPAKPRLDLSGHMRVGVASFYAKMFAGRQMADGTNMDPHGDNAASRTLPLGTTAKVTNIETGQSAVVTIQDRGPYVKGRIVDLSPSTARDIGITQKIGVAKVQVAPIAVPLPDGSMRPGVAGQDAKP